MHIKPRYPKATCKDGFSFSAQASSFNYCQPREDYPEVYESVELGYPSKADNLIQDYAENPERPTDTVYPGVPVEVVNALIQKHGGLVSTTPLPPGIDQ